MAKIELSDFVKYGKLFDLYGGLLSEDRQSVMNLYFNYNMTLVEISKEKNISRQAVLDCITKSCQKLDSFESKLNVNSKKEEIERLLEKLKSEINEENLKSQINNIINLLGEI